VYRITHYLFCTTPSLINMFSYVYRIAHYLHMPRVSPTQS
jgi:hypothetical protein